MVAAVECHSSAATTQARRASPGKSLEVASQQRVEDPPFAAGVVFDDPGVTECPQGLVGDVGRESLVELGAERDALDDPLRVSPERPHVSERLLVLEPVSQQGALGAGADMRDSIRRVGSSVAT